MANPTVAVSLANPDPSANPTSLQDLVTLLNTLFQASLQGSFASYVISSTTPAVGDQDKAWFKTDNNGRPLEVRMYYNGAWRRFYSGKATEIAMFTGDPSVYFDGTGLGLVGLEWDGWALCNGDNATPNLSNLFVIGGAMDNADITGYSSGWQTNVTGAAAKTGGLAQYSIQNNDLPNMTITVTGKDYSAGANSPPPRVLVSNDHAGSEKVDPNPIASFGSNPSATPPVPQTAVPTIPPFLALAYAKFVGYS